MDQRGFAAAGASDNRRCFSRLCRKADMLQRILRRPFITERHILKGKLALRFFQLTVPGSGRIMDTGPGVQHLLDTFRSHAGTGQHDGKHGNHQEGHDNLHGISNKRHHIAHLEVSRIDPLSAKPDNHNGNAVHDHHHKGHHKGHNPVGEQLGSHQILISCFKSFFFKFLTAEGADNGHAGEYFPGYQVQPVNQGLHFLKLRHGYLHQDQNHHGNCRNCYADDPAQPGSGTGYLNYAADTDDRRIKHHTQQHDLYHLYLGENLSSQIHTYFCRRPGGQKARQYGRRHHKKRQAQHFGAGRKQVVHLHIIQVHSHGFIFSLNKKNGFLGDDGIAHISHFLSSLFFHFLQLCIVNSLCRHHFLQAGHVRLPGLLNGTEYYHRHSEILVEAVNRFLIRGIPFVNAVLQIISLKGLVFFVLRHKQGQAVKGFLSHSFRDGIFNTSLLYSHVHNIRGVGRQRQVAIRLTYQKKND